MKIYFLGICGTAMGNAALLLQSMGHTVIGSDTRMYPPMSEVLINNHITVLEGYDVARLQQLNPDLIVIGNAISRGNVEIEWLWETNAFEYVSLPQLLSKCVLAHRRTIVVSGTHGKTTTTAACTYLLSQQNHKPGYLIGGVVKDFEYSAAIGSPDSYFVIEGDEYDSAFFDKRSKFIHYRPFILILNNLEFDHADIFRDVPDIQRSFAHLLKLIPQNGYLLYNGDDARIKELLPIPWVTHTLSVGVGPSNDLQIRNFEEGLAGSSFELWYQSNFWQKIEWKLTGLYNARNAAMAILASSLALNPMAPEKQLAKNIQNFQGVKRRQEIRYKSANLIIMEDFGHHPTALAETLLSLKNCYPNHSITACFEPRSNTIRTATFQNELCDALKHAHTVLISDLDKPIQSEAALSTNRLARELNELGVSAKVFNSNNDLLAYLKTNSTPQPSHLICFFSNASFDGIIPLYLAYLQS
jgi:UDP-N-acetylmuramate: L-alanyl-gamma-D-glutamyl-meso-diaminopimelate ligase